MRQIYREYHDSEKLQPLVGEISWSHNLVIMSRCKDPLEREFYLRMTRKFGWRSRTGKTSAICCFTGGSDALWHLVDEHVPRGHLLAWFKSIARGIDALA